VAELHICFHDNEEIGPAALAKSEKTPAYVKRTCESILRG
jgi:hypothetical protein